MTCGAEKVDVLTEIILLVNLIIVNCFAHSSFQNKIPEVAGISTREVYLSYMLTHSCGNQLILLESQRQTYTHRLLCIKTKTYSIVFTEQNLNELMSFYMLAMLGIQC